jgi:DNA-binding transcriptional ArsR family regulator
MKTKSTPLEIDGNGLRKAALHFRAINHQLRLKILQLLHQNKRMTVSSIYYILRIEQSVTSQHLAILRRANLVVAERDGKRVFYSVNYSKLQQMKEVAAIIVGSEKK